MSRKHRWYSARPPDTEKKPEPKLKEISGLCSACGHRVQVHVNERHCPRCSATLRLLAG
jgi:hypothetical protein